ncbi:afsK [Symbiodinium necroappetens]|uniref:AfsK protein n=1 Tax=Symbiodinium necroappetens TaxID=1628268 RepID=A0A812MP65_9DINO|nr:afsK [Symbiodinium necroappetens]
MPSGFARRAPMLAILLAATTFVGGCASDGSSASAGSSSSSASDAPDNRPAHRRLGFRLEWKSTPVTARRAKIADVAVYDDVLAVRDSVNTMSVLEISTGVNRWAGEVARPLDVVHGIARTDGGEIAVSTDIELHLYDAKTGTLTQRQEFDFLTSTAPVIIGRYVVLGGENGQLLIHNMDSGYRQHAYDFGGRFDVPPIAIGHFVGAVSRNGNVYVIDPHRGSSIARTRVYAGVSATPDASEDALFVASLDQSLWAFETDSGDTRWRLRTEGKLTSSPVHHDGVVYCVIPKRGLSAIDAYSGDVIWENADVQAPPVVKRGDRLIVWDGAMAHAVQAVSGDIMDSVAMPGVSSMHTNKFNEGDLYTVSVRDTEIRRHRPIN